ncbi:class I SAM-dependent methyltransferase [Haliangium sp.]|uniref:class I SAM-dependent methyltransferase n=1 Tax=Haliangium sp. TaxID=2663208 RepID=UPI003D0C85BC
MASEQRYSEEPRDHRAFTEAFDRFYTRFAPTYDVLVKVLPAWRTWLRRSLPHVVGPRVLEVAFGTGWLMTQYADRVEAYGVDLNARMVAIARENLRKKGLRAELRQGRVESLPYPDARFDTVLSTMAFSGYPDAHAALSEMLRVLAPDGHLVLIDVNYPADGNWLGTRLTKMWQRAGDLVRDLGTLLREHGLDCSDQEIGGKGSVHLYVARRAERPAAGPGPDGGHVGA